MKEFTKGIFTENPLLVSVLGMCPALATTGSLENALGMGLAFTMVLFGSNFLISLLHKYIPKEIRIPAYIVIIASLVTVTEMIMQAYFPTVYGALGLYIALIVVNCVIMGRAEAYACKHGVLDAILDALGMGIGFTLALCVVAFIRELLGRGSLFSLRILPEAFPNILIFVLPAGAFITMGFIFGSLQWLKNRKGKE